MGAYVIGIDGGGTAAKGMTADTAGQVLRRFRGGTTNYNGAAREDVDHNVRELLRAARGSLPADGCAAVCIGSAGVNTAAAAEALRSAVRDTGFTCPLRIVADSVTAQAGALDGGPGIVLIAGTGSICFARRADGAQLQVGGNGHLIDDGGSGYDIARQMLEAIVRAHDGRAPATLLRDPVFEALHISDVNELVSWLYDERRTKKEIASLAVLLKPAWARHDSAARHIVRRAAESLAELARPAVSFMGCRTPLALSGSVLKHNAPIRSALTELLRSGGTFGNAVEIVPPKHEADYGAVLLARQLAAAPVP